MATPSQALYTILTAAVASTGAASRVYPRAAVPQTPTLPYVVYFRVSGIRGSLVGRGSANHARARYQVTSFAATQIEAEAIADAVMVGCRTAHTSPIKAIDTENGPYDLSDDLEGQESMVAAVAVDLGITYKEQ